MSQHHLAAIVLAAGKGTRFRSDLAKVLHRAAGRTLLGHVLESLRPLDLGQIVVVVGHQADEVTREAEAAGLDDLVTVVQQEQRGTGHAVQVAAPVLSAAATHVLVVPGDTPLLTAATLERLTAPVVDGRPGAMLTAEMRDPFGYGRVLRAADGTVAGVVEEKDATAEQRAIREVNAGMYLVARDRLVAALDGLGDDNAQAEVYLTDMVASLAARGDALLPVPATEEEIAGVNDRRQLADVAAVLRRRHLDHLMVEVGVTVVDPAATYVDVDVAVGRDTVLLPGTVLDGQTRVGAGAVIGPHSHLTACAVGDGATVHSSRAVEAEIGAGAAVGPSAHLRPGTRLAARTKAGAFVETKNAVVGEGSKLPHLAYVGDAEIGTGVNISCGVITVNYDGWHKHRTVVEDGAFVGCDTMLVAPVAIGAGAYTAAGSTITEDVPAGALAVARARQTVKEGWVERRRERADG